MFSMFQCLEAIKDPTPPDPTELTQLRAARRYAAAWNMQAAYGRACETAERSRATITKEFTAAARSLGCDVANVRQCGARHADGDFMSGIHYHVV